MVENTVSRSVSAARPALFVLLALACAGCDGYGPNPSGEVTLPEATRRIDAREAREAQLVTGTSRDDLPEYTGAPGPDGRWPARVGARGATVYRDADALVVGSEGPFARIAGEN